MHELDRKVIKDNEPTDHSSDQFQVLNMHHEPARLIAVCKRTFTHCDFVCMCCDSLTRLFVIYKVCRRITKHVSANDEQELWDSVFCLL